MPTRVRWGSGCGVAGRVALCALATASISFVRADPATGDTQPSNAGAPATEPAGELRTIPLQAAKAPEAVAGEASAARLVEVVVTATKREEAMREIPQTIKAVNGKALESIGARELADYISLVPGVTLQEGNLPSRRKISFRGVGPGDDANQTAGQLVGDVPLTDPFSAFVIPDVDPFDLKDVEVLIGPQGTVFGASALNGAIRWVPNPPRLRKWQGKAFADWMSIHEGGQAPSFGGALNVPVGDSAALRFAGVVQRAPGVIDNLQLGIKDSDRRNKWMGRAMGRWEPIERLQLNLSFLRQQSTMHDLPLTDNIDKRLSSNDRPGPSLLHTNFELANLDARYEFDWATLVAQASRLTKLADDSVEASNSTPAGAMGIEALRETLFVPIEGYVYELRLVSPDEGPWKWIGGVFMQDYRADATAEGVTPNPALLPPSLTTLPGLTTFIGPEGVILTGSAGPIKAREVAGFGELTRKLFDDRLELTAGARYYRTHLSAEITSYGAVILAESGQPSETNDFDQAEKGLSPRLAAKFKFNDNVSIYTNVARGFQFGGFNLSPPVVPTEKFPPEYKSSKLWSYEVGVRTDWLHRTLRLDVTGFTINWTDAQLKQTTPTLQTEFIDNVGKVKSRGLEATLAYLTPIRGLSLNVAASYIRAKTAVPFSSGGRGAPAGTDMPAAPHVQTSTSLEYELRLGSWLTHAAALHSYEGKAYDNIFHDHRIYGYQTFNLNFNLQRPDVLFKPMLTIGVTNLTDTRGLIGTGFSQSSAATAPSVEGLYSRPRTISARLSMEF